MKKKIVKMTFDLAGKPKYLRCSIIEVCKTTFTDITDVCLYINHEGSYREAFHLYCGFSAGMLPIRLYNTYSKNFRGPLPNLSVVIKET